MEKIESYLSFIARLEAKSKIKTSDGEKISKLEQNTLIESLCRDIKYELSLISNRKWEKFAENVMCEGEFCENLDYDEDCGLLDEFDATTQRTNDLIKLELKYFDDMHGVVTYFDDGLVCIGGTKNDPENYLVLRDIRKNYIQNLNTDEDDEVIDLFNLAINPTSKSTILKLQSAEKHQILELFIIRTKNGMEINNQHIEIFYEAGKLTTNYSLTKTKNGEDVVDIKTKEERVLPISKFNECVAELESDLKSKTEECYFDFCK